MKRKLFAASVGVPVTCVLGALALNCSSGAIVLPGVDSGNGGNGGSSSSGGGSSGGSGSSSSSSGSSGGAGSSSSGAGSSGGSSSGGTGSSSSSGGVGSSGGSSGSGSSSGGGDGGAASGPMSILDNMQWILPCGKNQGYSDLVCINQPAANCNTTNPYLTRGTINEDVTLTVGGDPATTYMVTARFRGIVETKAYQGGTKQMPTVSSDGWYVGGTPQQNDNYNVYMLGVSMPNQVYYVNALGNQTPAITPAAGHFSYIIDFVATFPINGGAKVRFLGDDSNCSAIRPCNAATSKEGAGGAGVCSMLTLPNFTPVINPLAVTVPPSTMGAAAITTQPYNGQFVVMELQSVSPPQ
jgi:hypothetical protein